MIIIYSDNSDNYIYIYIYIYTYIQYVHAICVTRCNPVATNSTGCVVGVRRRGMDRGTATKQERQVELQPRVEFV